MSNTAIETEDKLEDLISDEAGTEAIDGEGGEAEANTGFQGLIDGEDEPASEKTVPLISHLERVKKLNGRVSESNDDLEKERLRRESVEEQNKLLLARLQSENTLTKPKPEDFDTDEAYETAKEAYDDQRIETIANKKVEDRLAVSQTQYTKSNVEADSLSSQKAHYERAGELGIDNYVELEDNAINVLGNDVVREVINGVKNSEIILPYLGHPKNRARAAEIADLFAKGKHVAGLSEIAGLGVELKMKLKPKTSIAPDPELQIPAGSAGVTASDKKLDAMREKVANGTATMEQLMDLKRSLKV